MRGITLVFWLYHHKIIQESRYLAGKYKSDQPKKFFKQWDFRIRKNCCKRYNNVQKAEKYSACQYIRSTGPMHQFEHDADQCY